MKELVRKNIQNLAAYASARDEYSGSEGVFLDANENPYGVYNRYPDPHQAALKKRLSEIHNISPGRIFLGNGSDEVIDLSFRIFCEPGSDKALIFTPTYGMYEVCAQVNNVELITLPLTKEFQIDRESLEPFLSDPRLKLIILCSPNNPTGNLLRAEDIGYILSSFKGIVLIDEAYVDFCAQASFLERIETHRNLIISRTLSKAWGLAGARIGIACMHEEMLAYYNKVKAPYNISIPNQEAALASLNDVAACRANIGRILAEKELLVRKLKQLGSIRKIYQSHANFLLIEVDDANLWYSRLIEKKIIVRNRHPAITNCLRITIGTAQENQHLLTALQELTHG